MADILRLNIGGGNKRYPGWLNVDIDPSADIQCDIRNLPLADDIADEMMAIHVIEHFYHYEVQDVLWEWFRVLKPGAKLILECPDLIKACRQVIKDVDSARDPDPQLAMWPLYGDPRHVNPYMCHKWLYTPVTLIKEMQKAGFEQVQQEVPQFHMKEKRDMRITGVKP